MTHLRGASLALLVALAWPQPGTAGGSSPALTFDLDGLTVTDGVLLGEPFDGQDADPESTRPPVRGLQEVLPVIGNGASGDDAERLRLRITDLEPGNYGFAIFPGEGGRLDLSSMSMPETKSWAGSGSPLRPRFHYARVRAGESTLHLRVKLSY